MPLLIVPATRQVLLVRHAIVAPCVAHSFRTTKKVFYFAIGSTLKSKTRNAVHGFLTPRARPARACAFVPPRPCTFCSVLKFIVVATNRGRLRHRDPVRRGGWSVQDPRRRLRRRLHFRMLRSVRGDARRREPLGGLDHTIKGKQHAGMGFPRPIGRRGMCRP